MTVTDKVTPVAALLGTAIGLHRQGQLVEAAAAYRAVLERDPERTEAWRHLGTALCQQGRYAEGAEAFRGALRHGGEEAPLHRELARALRAAGTLGKSLETYIQATALDRHDASAWSERAAVHELLSQWDEAARCHGEALRVAPSWSSTHGLARALLNTGDTVAALAAADAGLAAWPDCAPLHNARGAALGVLKEHAAARACFERALALDPALTEAMQNHARTCLALADPDAALASYRRALAGGRRDPLLPRELADALAQAGRFGDAAGAVAEALAGDPHDPVLCLALGDLRRAAGDWEAALGAYTLGIAAMEREGTRGVPLPLLLYRRSSLLIACRQLEAARADARRLMAIDPAFPYAAGLEIYGALMQCDWAGLDTRVDAALAAIRRGEPALPPWMSLALSDDPHLQLQAARAWAGSFRAAPRPHAGGTASGRVRLAYLSGDLSDHPVARALAMLIEHHDRDALEVIGVSLAESPQGIDGVIARGFEQVIRAHQLPDYEVAARLRAQGVDIAVDLSGYTALSRPAILAARAAHIQVSFLGYPGTMGAPFIDYLICDRIAAPPERAACFSEQLLYLPHCMLPGAGPGAPEQLPQRKSVGLPERGVVFAAFHQLHKLTPDIFELWLTILTATPESVLWLSAAPAEICERLRRYAAAHGVHAERLIFAPRVPELRQHAARLGCADLFLDCFPYNGHTSACDALRVDLPVLSWAGSSLASRIGASLLTEVGVPELIVNSAHGYRSLAVELANDPARLAALRTRVRAGVADAPCFDARRFCRSLEIALLGTLPGSEAVQPRAAAERLVAHPS